MSDKRTITTSTPLGDIKPGDIITLPYQDQRWWRRLWFWLTGRAGQATRRRVFIVTDITPSRVDVDRHDDGN
jgi:hypothetical protein